MVAKTKSKVAPKANAQPQTPKAEAQARPAAATKLDQLVALLRGKDGASIAEMAKATGWQPHSVRGAISGAIKKHLGLKVVSERKGEMRRYRIAR